jgi:hypothetical protein
MHEPKIQAGMVGPGEYAPSGELQGTRATFTAAQISAAFAVEIGRVRRALAGEFGPDSGDAIDSVQAQHLSEVVLGDRPLAEREGALMRLGAFTPRPDHDWGIGEAAPDEESDRVAGDGDHASQH